MPDDRGTVAPGDRRTGGPSQGGRRGTVAGPSERQSNEAARGTAPALSNCPKQLYEVPSDRPKKPSQNGRLRDRPGDIPRAAQGALWPCITVDEDPTKEAPVQLYSGKVPESPRWRCDEMPVTRSL